MRALCAREQVGMEEQAVSGSMARKCKEYLRPFKRSLRKLHLPQHLSRKKKVKYMKESVTVIGDRIDLFLQQHCRASEVRHWKKMLWRFASLFSDKDEKQLQKLYKYIKRNKMQKFQLLCCPSEGEDSHPERKLKETTGSGWAAAVEVAATSTPPVPPPSSECHCHSQVLRQLQTPTERKINTGFSRST
ncbi:uncharacterized protein C17orf64 homolog isoform X2 [Phasianus colchicus]|uniref:uncharacterized protein C17orf64 homolog isoform X2 n=1 Tax=Phasianus colchicus TaxID=9054 RepID=UPI00129DC2D7|nr:uncharacterized protein C17orf64 homolog isoform X2 [Phasianus colchicus]